MYFSKSSKVSRTLLSILADLSNAEVWMVSTRPLISKSFSPCTIPLVTVPSASITIRITSLSALLSSFQFSSKFEVLIFIFAFFHLYSVVRRNSKVHNSASSLFIIYSFIYYYYYLLLLLFYYFFFFCYYEVWSPGRLAEIR